MFLNHLFPFISYNKLNSICFMTPELGKWSTIGGLGVMIDELSQGLASINEKIIVISPYYHRNKKN
jgi:starch synthase